MESGLVDEESNGTSLQFEPIEPPPTLQPEPGVEEEANEELRQENGGDHRQQDNFESF